MITSMKVILTAVSIAAVASPVMAQSGMLTIPSAEWQAADGQPRQAALLPASIAKAHGSAARAISKAHGSVSKARGSVARVRTAPVIEEKQINIDDAVHVPFPQRTTGN